MKALFIIRKVSLYICVGLLVLTIFFTMSLTATKDMLSRERIAEYIKKSDILEVKASKIFNISTPSINENTTIKDAVIILAKESNIPDKVIDDLIESNELNKLLADLLNGIINYIITDKDKPMVSSETKSEIIETANRFMESHIVIVMEKEELEQYVNTYIDILTDSVVEKDTLIKESYDFSIIKQIIYFNMNYLYLISVVLMVMIGLLSYWYVSIKYLGIVLIGSGILFSAIGSLKWPIYSLVKMKIEMTETIMSPLLDEVLIICFKEGAFCTMVGIFLILLFIVMKRFITNNKKLDNK